MELLSDVCDATLVRPADLRTDEQRVDHSTFVKILDWKIASTPVVSCSTEAAQIMELHKIAMQVYLNRATEDILNHSDRTRDSIARAFCILSKLRYCDRQFPVFILGCEARSDEERAVILDIMTRTEKEVPSRTFNYCSGLVQAMWSQDDLSEGRANYWGKLNYLFSHCQNMPTFV